MFSEVTPAQVLKFLRDQEGPHTLELLAAVHRVPVWPTGARGSPPQYTRYKSVRSMGHTIIDFAEAGLVRVRTWDPSPPHEAVLERIRHLDPNDVVVTVDERWPSIQEVLSVSLTEQIMRQRGVGMMLSPVFGPLNTKDNAENSGAFVVMPFTTELAPVYDQIRMTLLQCGLRVSRADGHLGAGVVAHDIWSSICSSELVIADLTGRNANVFYEIGVAHTVGVPTLLLTQHPNELPFNIRHHRVIPYRSADLAALSIALEGHVRTQSERPRSRITQC